MTFADRLAAIKNEFESGDTPPEIIGVLNGHVDYLIQTRVAENALQVGMRAPLNSALSALNSLGSPAAKVFNDPQCKQFLILNWFRGNW